MTLDFDLLIWIIGSVPLVVMLCVFWKRRRSASYLLCFTVFWVYCMLAVKETIFPIPISDDIVGTATKKMFLSSVNLIPLYFGKHLSLSTSGVIRGIILNILLTVPFGFGISFISRIKPKDIFRLALTVGFSIEGVQLVISMAIGFPYRIIDINDIILNTVGVIVGYGCFKVFALLYVTITRRLNPKLRGFLSYIYAVVTENRTAAFNR